MAVFVISSNSPLAIVENPNFIKLLQYCNSSKLSISRCTLGQDLHVLYNSLFKQVYQSLLDHLRGSGKVSLTLDAWSSTTRILFLGITGHYIESSTWQFKSLLLGFECLRGSHSAGILARVCIGVLQRFGLTSHI